MTTDVPQISTKKLSILFYLQHCSSLFGHNIPTIDSLPVLLHCGINQWEISQTSLTNLTAQTKKRDSKNPLPKATQEGLCSSLIELVPLQLWEVNFFFFFFFWNKFCQNGVKGKSCLDVNEDFARRRAFCRAWFNKIGCIRLSYCAAFIVNCGSHWLPQNEMNFWQFPNSIYV